MTEHEFEERLRREYRAAASSWTPEKETELIRRVIGGEEVGEYRDDDHHHHVYQPDDRPFVAFEIVPELLQRGHWHRCGDNFIFSNL